MKRLSGIHGILFDMDNTLLQSNIDFAAMKRDIFRMLSGEGWIPANLALAEHTTSTLIALAQANGLPSLLEQQVWRVAAEHEKVGMADAGLEPGAAELLAKLAGRVTLAVVTNNAYEAARVALEKTGISDSFALVVGREQMTKLKPSPSGYRYALERLNTVPAKAWIAVGDSWIDGQAAFEAGIPFIGYRTNEAELRRRGIDSVAELKHLNELPGVLEL